jgi:arylsulfatase
MGLSMRTSGNIIVALLASVVCIAAKPASAQQSKPNILFILADNIGYGDICAYGGGELRGAPTPRIDQLAAESLRLTQFLVEPASDERIPQNVQHRVGPARGAQHRGDV